MVNLKQFYASELGHTAAGCISRRLNALWPEVAGETTLGLGYTVPFLPASSNGHALSIAAMPAAQGALYWPTASPNRALLADEARLPFADSSFNRVLLVHVLEHSGQLTELMEELWRVLIPGGRIMAVVPNRLGVWARSGSNPFGSGRPFSARQIRELAASGGFTFTRMDSALFLPPVVFRWLLKAMPWMDRFGSMFCPQMGGVLLIEVEKQIYAALKEPVRARGQMVMSPVSAQPAFMP